MTKDRTIADLRRVAISPEQMDSAIDILVHEGRAERILINGEPGLRLIRKDEDKSAGVTRKR